MNKSQLFDELIADMGKCSKCIHMNKNKSLINFYNDIEFAKTIPSIWTDWYKRLDSEIMIIGQDWGPFDDMKKLNELYISNKNNWNNLIESEKSMTKRKLTEYMITSSNGVINSIDNIYITNAIMCARKGKNYRGSNIDLKNSTYNCKDYLLRQIKIINPKIILTLGYYPLLALSKIFTFNIERNLRDTIKKRPIINVDGYIIIPLYHPVAQIKKDEQLKQYKKIWEYL